MPEAELNCISCRRAKAGFECGQCLEHVCKNCEQFLDAQTFSFLQAVPEELSHTHYCPGCYDAHVAPALESYHSTMEQAKEVFVFFTTQRRPIPVVRRAKDPKARLHVKECGDRDETILRLAFQAVEQGFNAIMDTEVVSEKVRHEAYQTTRWRGIGTPVEVDVARLERQIDDY